MDKVVTSSAIFRFLVLVLTEATATSNPEERASQRDFSWRGQW